MLTSETKRRIDNAKDILVGKVPIPSQQIEQITIALIYKFMSDIDKQDKELGGEGFFVGEFKGYSWEHVIDMGIGGQERLDLYSKGLSEMSKNPHLPQMFRDIFKNTFLPFKDPSTLDLFLKEINGFSYDHSEDLGDAFEYLLSSAGSQGDAGQFRTPRHIIDFIVSIVQPKYEDTILDPACGTAGFLISAYKYILNQNGEKSPGDKLNLTQKKELTTHFEGYDITPEMVKLSLVNMYLHNFGNPKIYEYDTLSREDRWDDKFDCILANPPFMTPKGGIKPHNRFSIKASKSEVLFVDYIIEHLNHNGKAGIIVPEGIIFQGANAYKEIRRKMIEENFLWGVISLPAGIFQPYSGVKTSILLLDKELAKKTDKIMFYKVENDGYSLSTQRKPINKNDLPKVVEDALFYKQSLLNNNKVNIEESSTRLLVMKEKILGNDYNLSMDRYMGGVSTGNTEFELANLFDIAEIKRGSTITKNDVMQGDIPVIAGGKEPAYYHNQSNRDGDIITVSGSGANAGYLNYFNEPIFASDCFTIKGNDNVNTKYIYYILKGKQEYIYSFKQGGGIPHVSPRDFACFKIPLPSLEEQKKIVEELDNYQKIIDGCMLIIKSYKPLININPDWDIVRLGDICEKITDGTHLTPKYVNEGVPFLRVTDITKTGDDKKFITFDEHLELIKRCHPKKGDVLYTKNGTIGIAKMVDWDRDFSIFVSLCLIRPKTEIITSKYLECYLNSENAYQQAIAHSKSGVITNLHLVEIKSFNVPLPTLEEQNLIVEQIQKEEKIIEEVKHLIEIYEKKIKDKINEIWGK